MSSLLPEFLLILTAFFILIIDLFDAFNSESSLSPEFYALSGIGFSIISLFALWGYAPTTYFGGQFVVEEIDIFFKGAILVAGFFTVTLLPAIFNLKNLVKNHYPEFIVTLLFTLSGMLFLASSRDLVTLYVSLEMATLPLFALTAWEKSKFSAEGAIKYLILGAVGSSFLIFGFGILYAFTGSLSFESIRVALAQPHQDTLNLVLLAVAFIIPGLGFKLTLFPFHTWAPDAYQASPTPVTAFLSTASKVTGLVLATHLLLRIFSFQLKDLQLVMVVLSVATMTLGNFVAMKQENIKRFMAYSSISQAGYLLLGFLTLSPEGIASVLFYSYIYIFTNMAAFAVITLHIEQTQKQNILSLKGLSKTSPGYAAVLMLALFSLAGIPPLSGFVGKFFLFSIAAKQGYHIVVAIAAINSTVSLYYYLKIIKQMYINSPDEDTPSLKAPLVTKAGLILATMGTVFIGLIAPFYDQILWASEQWFKLWIK